MRIAIVALIVVVACEPTAAPRPPVDDLIEVLPTCPAGTPLPEDPGESLAGWSAVGGTLTLNNGRVVGEFTATCDDTALMTKTVDLPSCAMPLALTVFTRSPRGSGPNDSSVVLGGGAINHFTDIAFPQCVGERAFRSDSVLEIRPRVMSRLCEEGEIVLVEEVRLQEEPNCPAPGTIVDFDQWTVARRPGGTVRFEDGRIELQVEELCGAVIVSGPESGTAAIPNVPGVGIKVDVVVGEPRGGTRLEAFVGALFHAELVEGGNVICLPRALQGSTEQFGFSFVSASSIPPTEVCPVSTPHIVTVHKPSFVTSCEDEDIVNADLEEPPVTWRTSGNVVINDGVAVLDTRSLCLDEPDTSAPHLSTPISIPAPSERVGAAARVRYSLRGDGTATMRVDDVASTLSDTGGELAEGLLCLPPKRGGELRQLTFSASTSCLSGERPAVLEIDSVDVGFDEACRLD